MTADRTRLALAWLAACFLAAGLQAAETEDSPDAAESGAAPRSLEAGELVTLWEAQEIPDLEIKFIAKDATGGWLYVKNLSPVDVRIEMPLVFVAQPNPDRTTKRSAHIEETQVLGGGFAHTKRSEPSPGSEASRNAGAKRAAGDQRAAPADDDAQPAADLRKPDEPAKAEDDKKEVGPIYTVRGKRSLHLAVACVCLEYGKPEPNSQLPYRIRPAESFTTQAELVEVLKRYAKGQATYGPAQAAAWHLANHLSWEELAAKRRGDGPLLSPEELRLGMALVKSAEKYVRDNPLPQ
ncbi:MAG TPA: hypothetical protein VGE52_05945 [Pirellulales bacterium]